MKPFCFVLLNFIACMCFAQEAPNFTLNKQFYLKGNSALIGNNIISLDRTEALNNNSKFNDIESLIYVDIDNDDNTFSSSQATLNIPENSKIKYAAIYWSAIYPYNYGKAETKRINNEKKIVYVGDGKRDDNINNILFKTPNSKYIPINGTIVLDEITNTAIENTHPYVCFADVTTVLQNEENNNGNYTLGNIKATQGYVSGGCSAGWLLYVVYENDNDTAKYFTVYNGFADVFEEPVNILFQNFKTPEDGDIKTSLLLGTLEGDKKIKGDHCGFLDANNNYVPLANKVRPKFNFFNSSITVDEKPFLERLPASTNTLGFDLLKMNIPNKNNNIIANNSNRAAFQLNSKLDRYYLFFVAFETEINPVYLEKNEPDTTNLIPKKKIVNKLIEAEEIDKDLEKIINMESIRVPNTPKGYYLVTNVFSKKYHASMWITFLKEKKYNPKVFINPKNGWHSVYVDYNLDPITIYKKLKELSLKDYFKDLWITKVNF